jgi:uncharacterized protein YhaN
MRIVSIHVQGFGVLRERTLETDSPLTLFYGANEAGKSTLMGFVRAVLFGFPSRANPAERYEPLRGGAHGGSLTLLDEQGQRILVERYGSSTATNRRSSAGIVKVTLGDGTTGGEELLNALLGGLSADLFRSLFAFGLGELQELRTLQTDEISGYLYSAGLGISGSAIMDAERKLATQLDTLYKPRGRNQEINRFQKELEELERNLRRSKDLTSDYERLKDERIASEQIIEQLELHKQKHRIELQKWEHAAKGRASWFRLKQLDRELELLPDRANFPEHATARLEALEEEIERCNEDRTRLNLKLGHLQAELAKLELNPIVLANKSELDRLAELIPIYQENQRADLEMAFDHGQLELQLERLLKQIDERWDLNTLAVFPISISQRERIRQFREQLAEQREAIQRLQAEQDSLKLQMDRLQEAGSLQEEELRKSKSAWSGRSSAAWHANGEAEDPARSLQRIARDYAQWKLAHSELEHQRERLDDLKKHNAALMETENLSRKNAALHRQKLAWLSSAAFALITIWLLWQKDELAASLAAVLLVASIAYLLVLIKGRQMNKAAARANRFTQPSAEEDKLQAKDDQLTELERTLQQQVELLLGRSEAAAAHEASFSITHNQSLLPRVPARTHERATGNQRLASDAWPITKQWLDHSLEDWQVELEKWRIQQSEVFRKQEKLKDLKHSLQVLERQAAELAAEMEISQTRKAAIQKQWSEWLQSMGLHGELTPDAAMESLQLVEQGHELLRQCDKLASKRDLLGTQIAQFEQAAVSYLGVAASSDPLLSFKRWKEQAEEQLMLQETKQRMELQQIEAEQEKQLADERLNRTLERMQSLLAEASAATGEQLRHNQSQQEQRAKFLEERNQLEAVLESQAGNAMLTELQELWEHNSDEELLHNTNLLKEQLSKMEEDANRQRVRNGRLSSEIEKLEQGTDLANQLQHLEEHRANMEKLVEQYAVASFAALLLKKARDVYERERQPNVLLRASEYFQQMTQGRYVQIKAPFGEQRLVAIQENGQTVDTGFLSRGTAEQLYLAMRFSLAEEYAGKAVLPLVLDDIMVNFDLSRMESCLEVIRELSSRHQILFFTCHPHVRDAVARLIPKHRYIEL